jgi:hypothetical protein
MANKAESLAILFHKYVAQNVFLSFVYANIQFTKLSPFPLARESDCSFEKSQKFGIRNTNFVYILISFRVAKPFCISLE